jgi:RNA methyltransferase, TrmH family
MPDPHRTRLIAVGSSHPQVRRYLDAQRGRTSRDEATVEGLWFIRRAWQASVPLHALFVCPGLLPGDAVLDVVDLFSASARFEVSERVLRRMVSRDGPDGVAAIVGLPHRELSDIVLHGRSRVLVAHGFEQAGNLGATIRAADGSGATAVVVTDQKLRRNNPRVVRGSMGSIFSVPVIETDATTAIVWLRDSGVRIIAADPAATLSYRDVSYAGPVALVLGSERVGLAEHWRHAADALVRIPMLGAADSLNVGHAAAVILYEAAHQQGDA